MVIVSLNTFFKALIFMLELKLIYGLSLQYHIYCNCVYIYLWVVYFHMLLHWCLASFHFTWKTAFITSSKAGLVVTKFFNFCLSEKVHLPSVLNNSFARYNNIFDGQFFFSFSTLNISPHSVLGCNISD